MYQTLSGSAPNEYANRRQGSLVELNNQLKQKQRLEGIPKDSGHASITGDSAVPFSSWFAPIAAKTASAVAASKLAAKTAAAAAASKQGQAAAQPRQGQPQQGQAAGGGWKVAVGVVILLVVVLIAGSFIIGMFEGMFATSSTEVMTATPRQKEAITRMFEGQNFPEDDKDKENNKRILSTGKPMPWDLVGSADWDSSAASSGAVPNSSSSAASSDF